MIVRVLSTVFCGTALVACGGGGSAVDTVQTLVSESQSHSAIYPGRGTPVTDKPGVSPANKPPVQTARLITDVIVESTAGAQSNVPVTFGQVFAEGNIAAGAKLSGQLDDGTNVPLQMDIKASHADGSVRHAIISGVLPSLSGSRTLKLMTGAGTAETAASPSTALNSGLTASFAATIDGVRYSASADELLKSGKFSTWLNGSVVSEWQVSAPLKTSTGQAHPHLTARFAIRWYDAIKSARVDVIIENNWAYEAAPRNFTYDAEILVNGKAVYAKPAMEHYHHARWRKVFWNNGAEPAIHIKHNIKYLIDTRAVPNYDQTTNFTESNLAAWQKRWANASVQPMNVGLANPYMPLTGGRDDIGLLPGWTATYLLTMDKRIKEMTLGTADLAGSWSSHYRDRDTDQPISLLDYPYMTILGTPGDTKNPKTKKAEAFPKCAETSACKSPYSHDTSHQPNFAYLPYIVTGDHYYLEELQFWAMYNSFNGNPGYRENIKGLFKPEQVRSQAWSLRSVSEAAYITPDSDRLKSHFAAIVKSNLDWYNTSYTNSGEANPFGVMTHGYAMAYEGGRGLSPWQDDFFTSAVGHAAELGFAEAKPLLQWKAKFSIQRMIAPGTCWVDAAIYAMVLRDSKTSPLYTSMAQAYQANHSADIQKLECGSAAMAKAFKIQVGEMKGYGTSVIGYTANMQPALAYATDVTGSAAAPAWKLFYNRPVKPNFGTSPQFAIVPR